MSQFDVYPGARGRGYLLDCQTGAMCDLGSRVVVPLLPLIDITLIPRLHPTFTIEGREHVMATHLIFAIPAERLGASVMSLEQHRFDILNALDMLFSGF